MNRSCVFECLILKNAEIPTAFKGKWADSFIAEGASHQGGSGGMPPREILQI